MNLQNQIDYLPSLLDGVILPNEELDLELLKSVLVERCGLLEPLYSEPETMKQCISIWFRSHQWNIERLINLVKTSYRPLENYDRHEDLARDKNDTRNRTENRTQNFTENGTVNMDDVTERTVAAFNTDVYSPADKTRRDADTATSSGGQTAGQTAGTEAGAEAEHAVNYIHGNIGVMTSQAMFTEETALLDGFNIYQFIVNMFSRDLMLSIW